MASGLTIGVELLPGEGTNCALVIVAEGPGCLTGGAYAAIAVSSLDATDLVIGSIILDM